MNTTTEGALEKTGRYLAEGFGEFCRHPIKHSAYAVGSLAKGCWESPIGEFARDYWDLPVTALGGILLAESLQYDIPSRTMLEGMGLFFGVPVLSYRLNSDSVRATRNIGAGISGALLDEGIRTGNSDSPYARAIGYAETLASFGAAALTSLLSFEVDDRNIQLRMQRRIAKSSSNQPAEI